MRKKKRNIPDRVLRKAWIAGVNARYKNFKTVEFAASVEDSWKKHIKRNLAGMRASAKVIREYLDIRGKE